MRVFYLLTIMTVGATAADLARGADLIAADRVPKPSKNYVLSGDFEPPAAERWQGEGIRLTNTASVAGTHSLHLRGNGTDRRRRDISVPLEVGQTYTLSAWMRSRNLVTAKPGTELFGVGIMVSDAGWFWQVRIGPAKATTDWRRYSVTFVAPPTAHYDEQFFQVVALLPQQETGELWVDNLQIEGENTATAFTARALPDLTRVVLSANKLDARLRGRSAVLDRLAANAAPARPLVAACHGMLTDLKRVAACVENFDTITDARWRHAIETVDRISRQVATNAWATCWTNPWQRYTRWYVPGELGHAGEGRVVIGVNDYVPLALMVTNLSASAMEIQVQLLARGAPRSRLLRSPAWATLRQARMVAALVGKPAEYPSVLCRLDEGGVLTVGAGESAQLWIDVESVGLEPGDHQADLVLTPYQDVEPATIPVTVRVLPVVLPEACPAEVFCFGLKPLEGLGERAANMTVEEIDAVQRPWLEDMVRHGVNRMFHHTQHFTPRFDGNDELAAPLDFTWHDRFLEVKRRYIPNLAGGYSVGYYHLPNAAEASYERRFAALMRAWLGHLRDRGVSIGDFPLELFDEPSGDRLAQNRVAYRVLKEVAPNAKTMAAISVRAPEDLKAIAPLMDIMVVHPDLSAEADQALRESGKEVWIYECKGSLEKLHPYSYYRLLAWKTWAKGYSGFGFTWGTYCIEFKSPRSNEYSHFYYGRGGPVPSRGWQGFWRGTRDWTCLHTLRRAIAAARRAGKDEAAAAAEDLLRQATTDVVTHPDDPALADTWRVRLLERIRDLELAPE